MAMASRKQNRKFQSVQKNQNKRRIEAESAPIQLSTLQLVFAAALFTSASLLFTIEPLAAKMLLPLLGGSPSVWTTCMVFFQALLLGGYFYAHVLSTRFTLKKQAIIHMGLILASVVVLPVNTQKYWGFFSHFHPMLGVIGMLAVSIGLPFLALSASAPLLQHWFAQSNDPSSKNPYFLYGASNLGSLIALAAYSIVIEPNMGLSLQSFAWTFGYGALAVLVGACLYRIRLSRKAEAEGAQEEVMGIEESEDAPSTLQKMRWVGLAFVPSSLMLGVTTFFTTDIATIPFLWAIPLGLYLATFVIVFSKYTHKMHKVVTYAMPLALVTLLYYVVSHTYVGVSTSLMLHLGTFFIVTMMLHGELALTRPSVRYLTQFYLLMSFGGLLGGLFNGVLAPLIFKSASEYTVALLIGAFLLRFNRDELRINLNSFSWPLHVGLPVAMLALTTWFVVKWPLAGMPLEWFSNDRQSALLMLTYGIPAMLCLGSLFLKRPAVFGLMVVAFTSVGLYFNIYEQYSVFKDRSFFGILKISDNSTGEYRTLVNGTTVHGRQFLNPEMSQEPLTYYHKQGPVGQIFDEFSGPNTKKNLAFIGLGTGTLTSYSQPGQNVDVYEIDKHVLEVANTYFTYLKNAKGNVNVIMGDARLKLKEATDEKYGIILVDAFSSDAIPVHMLTREALTLYLQKLEKGGILAIHTSNRYLALEPVVGRLAKELRLVARVNHDVGDSDNSKFASTWIGITRADSDFGSLANSSKWQPLDGYAWTPVWTDDFTSLFGVLRW